MTARLEDLKPDGLVQGLVGREAVRIVSADMLGDMACKVVFRGQDGVLGEQLVFRSNEADLELVGGGRKWSFSGSAAEAHLAMTTRFLDAQNAGSPTAHTRALAELRTGRKRSLDLVRAAAAARPRRIRHGPALRARWAGGGPDLSR